MAADTQSTLFPSSAGERIVERLHSRQATPATTHASAFNSSPMTPTSTPGHELFIPPGFSKDDPKQFTNLSNNLAAQFSTNSLCQLLQTGNLIINLLQKAIAAQRDRGSGSPLSREDLELSKENSNVDGVTDDTIAEMNKLLNLLQKYLHSLKKSRVDTTLQARAEMTQKSQDENAAKCSPWQRGNVDYHNGHTAHMSLNDVPSNGTVEGSSTNEITSIRGTDEQASNGSSIDVRPINQERNQVRNNTTFVSADAAPVQRNITASTTTQDNMGESNIRIGELELVDTNINKRSQTKSALPYHSKTHNLRSRTNKSIVTKQPQKRELEKVLKKRKVSSNATTNGKYSHIRKSRRLIKDINEIASQTADAKGPQRSLWKTLAKVTADQLAPDDSFQVEVEKHRLDPLELLCDRAPLIFPGTNPATTFHEVMNGRVDYLTAILKKTKRLDYVYIITCMVIEDGLRQQFWHRYKEGRPNTDMDMVRAVLHDRYRALVDDHLKLNRPGQWQSNWGKMSPREAMRQVTYWRHIGQKGWWLHDNICPGIVFILPRLGIPIRVLEKETPLNDKEGELWVRTYLRGSDSRLVDLQIKKEDNLVLRQIKHAVYHLRNALNIKQILHEQGLNNAMRSIMEAIHENYEKLAYVP